MSAAAAAERPIHIIESGPAAGVVGAAELARRLGNLSLLSFDMGGTTAKAALVDAGRFLRVNSLEVGGGINIAGRLLSGGGYHVRAPAIDIAEVGAGGGSLARLDAGGALRVGRTAPARCRGLRATDAAASFRQSPTRTSSWASSIPGRSRAAGCPSAANSRSDRCRPRSPARCACGSRMRRGACTAWPTPRWRGRSARCPPSAAATRATCRCSPSAAMGRCMRPRSARLLDIRNILVPPVPGLFSAARHAVSGDGAPLCADMQAARRPPRPRRAGEPLSRAGSRRCDRVDRRRVRRNTSTASSAWWICATPAPIPS